MTHGGIPVLILRLVLLLVPVVGPAQPVPPPERRVALVIGVGAYQSAPQLANPVGDARSIGESLRRLNFEVEEVLDPDFRRITRALREFGIRAQRADVALVYYAGHGVQVGRENYLLPADAKLERERDLLYEALPLNLLLGEASQAARLGIVLLDACRNNPFVDRMSRSMTIAGRGSTSPGLARVDDVPRNTLVVMATKADQVAEDGTGSHSPFADALLAHFQIPGLELSLFFRSVRDTVLRATNNRQEPFIFSSLGAEPFYFYPRPPNRPPVLAGIPVLEVRDTAGPTALPIAKPTDPDQDPMSIRITGLPRSGEVRIDGRVVTPGAVFGADRFASATYKPEGKALGPVGTLDILVEDGRGGSVMGSLPITVVASNRPPVVEAARRVRIYTGPLQIVRPEDPDGDTLAVIIQGLPRGLVRNGTAALRPGDRLQPEELGALVFLPEPGFSGAAGSLAYAVEDGRGGRAESALEIEVMDAAEAAGQMAEAALWDRLRTTGKAEDIDAFLRFYPSSRYAAAARQRRDELAGMLGPAAALPERLAMVQPPPPARPVPQPFPAVPAEPPRAFAVPSTPPAPAVAGERYFQDCPDCPWMVRLPPGSFMMGQGARDSAALPVRRVSLQGFALGQFPVTVAEWQACQAKGGCGPLPRLMVAEPQTPLHNVSWDDARTYATWLSRTTGRAYRLPTEAEWEYAARAGTTTRYWWGDQPGVAQANCADCGGEQNPRGPLPVDRFQPNGFGLHGMLGGVAQWVQDCWAPSYQGAPLDGTARESGGCMKRVLRGGSFRSGRDDILPVARNFYDAPVRYQSNGFRVARALE